MCQSFPSGLQQTRSTPLCFSASDTTGTGILGPNDLEMVSLRAKERQQVSGSKRKSGRVKEGVKYGDGGCWRLKRKE